MTLFLRRFSKNYPFGLGYRRGLVAVGGLLTALGLGWGIWGSEAFANPSNTQTEEESREAQEIVENVFLPPDRATLQNISQAKELLGKGRYSEAVIKLGEILNQPEDFFFQPRRDQPGHRSLQAEAQRLIGEMPAAGRRQYEEEFGARAEKMLLTAVAAGDMAGLAEVSRHYFHTRAGYQATFLLGLDHLEHGRPLAGALVLNRLLDFPEATADLEPVLSLSLATCWLRSGAPEKAKTVLVNFQRRYSGREILIAGRKTPLFSDETEALTWLRRQVGEADPAEAGQADGWAIYRGDPQRNAASRGSAPLMNLRWSIPVSDDPLLEEALGQFRRWELEQGVSVLPSLHPLAVDDVVLMRTFRNLLAVDFLTGKRLWEVPVGETAEPVNTELLLADVGDLYFLSTQIQLAAQHLCEDTAYGTLSSDGRLVFSVEEAPLENRFSPYQMRILRGRRVFGPQGVGFYNWLTAHDLHTGKRRWHVGGPTNELGLPLSENYFLGPPLPLMGQLYVLAEAQGEIRLLVLDAESGRLLWSQQLAMVDAGIQQDPTRRLIAATPSYSDGILVCPTAVGALVAVDLATRSLLWGYQYGLSERGERASPFFPAPIFADRVLTNPQAMEWIDPAVCIAEGRVFITPLESDALHCLNLADGALQWKVPRQDDLYLACVHRGKVVLVGRRRVHALRLSDGEPAWEGRAVELPEGVMPSGRGFYNGNAYFLPVDAGEVLTIDLDEGKIRDRAKSRSGNIPGNLVCCQGRILSQNLETLSLFAQRDAVEAEVQRRLAIDPNDAEALRLSGEVLWDSGRRGEAIDCFRRAQARHPNPRTRELLRDALLEGLREEFALYRRQTGEIQSLLDKPAQQALFLRLMADGLQRNGEMMNSFEQTLQLADLQKDQLPLEILTNSLSVRRDRWVQAQLAALRAEAPPDVAAQMNAALAARWEAARSAPAPNAWSRFFDYFGNQPAAELARKEYLAVLQKAGRLLEAEWNLWQMPPGGNPALHPKALAAVAALYRQAGRPEAAATAYRWLLQHVPDTACIAGKTPREFLAALAADDPLRTQMEPPDPWPTGKVEVKKESPRSPNLAGYGRIPIPLRGSPGPFFADVNFLHDQNRGVLICRDSLGRERWNLWLIENRQARRFMNYYRGPLQAYAWGHLLLLWANGQALVLDTLGDKKHLSPRVLWPKEDSEMRVSSAVINRLGQMQAVVAFAPILPQPLPAGGNSALLTGRYVCFQRMRSLTALDPLTGQTLWERQGVPPESTLFGDEEYLFVLPPHESEALVLRALDGELLGKRKLELEKLALGEKNSKPVGGNPPSGIRAWSPFLLATFGRQILYWKFEGDQKRVASYDPWTEKVLWSSQKFPAGARGDLVEHEALGVLDPQGKFTLLGLPDGRVLTQAALPPEPLLDEVIVWRAGPQYFVLAHSSPAELPRPSLQLPGTDARHINHGLLSALDRTGKLLWPEPVTVDNQYLVNDVPPGLPVVVFACHPDNRRNSDRRQYRVSLLLVDKRTGRPVYHKNLSTSPGVFLLSGDPEKKTLEISLPQKTVTLTFTDQPWPSAEELKKKAEGEKKSHPIRSLFKVLQRTAEQIIDPSFEEEEEEEEN